MIRPLRFAFALLMLAFLGTAAHAADGPGTKVVRSANDTIAALLKQKAAPKSEDEKKLAAKVTTSVRDFLDVDLLGQRALVDHWKDMKAVEQIELLGTLRALIEDSYIKGLRANLDYAVAYVGESKQTDGTLLVKTTITTKRRGRPFVIKVDYVLEAQGSKWRCFDVKTDGVGLVENYRAQFNKIINKDGVAGLIAKMKKKRASSANL
jgi:phospholipid transport system substrate-binding protein